MTMEGMAPEDILRMEQENEMMEKEAREKIAGGLPKNPYPNQYITDIGLTTHQIDREIEAGRIAYMEAQQDMIKAGYRKLPKEPPPLLTDEEMGKVKFDMGSPWGVGDRYTVGRAIAQAQWEICVKHYEGQWK